MRCGAASMMRRTTFCDRPARGGSMTATSLPELATDISAVRQDERSLAIGDLFGSSMANMLILAVADLPRARAFYDALGPWSARIGSAFDHDGRSYRATARVQANMFGVDSCSAAAGADHRCVLTFNAGDFLDGD